MQPPPATPTSTPYIRATHLANHIGKSINIAGSVATVNGPAIQLDGGDGLKVNFRKSMDDTMPVEVGMKVMVRGIVQGDTSVVGVNGFPVTNLGEKFDLSLHNDAVDVMSQTQFSPLFVG